MPDPETLKTAKAAALRYLSYKDRSEHEVAERLTRKGHPLPQVRETLAWLKHLGYLNDERFALLWGRARIAAKNIGEYRLRKELSARGLAGAIIEKTARALYSEFNEGDLALSCAQKKLSRLRGIDHQAKYRRLAQYLQRKGFPSDTVFKTVHALIPKGGGRETPESETRTLDDQQT